MQSTRMGVVMFLMLAKNRDRRERQKSATRVEREGWFHQTFS